MLNIKQRIRNWLGISSDLEILDKELESINEIIGNINQFLDFKKEHRSFIDSAFKKIKEIEERLRPNDRQRMEQIKSALDILTKYLNEINERT